MSQTQEAYDELISLIREASLLGSCASFLGWDEQTKMPPKGAEHRANQTSLLAGLIHDRATSPRIGELLDQLTDAKDIESGSPQAANIRETRRVFDRERKLPKRLVEEMSRVSSLSQQAWIEARKADDFGRFQPWLEQVVALKREEAEAVGYGDGVPYDALLDTYEPGMSTAKVQEAFDELRSELVPLVQEIAESSFQPEVEILKRSYPVDAQREFGQMAATAIGFDFDAGRLDEAAHPFCSDIGPGDCRLTTRYDDRFFSQAFFGTLHEAGHGIYEQGLSHDDYGTPMGQSVSLGIHESQSRMWENFVGRSRAFWEHFYPQAQSRFDALSDVSVERFHAAINDVRPSFIRVEADEVTYNLHIMLRFELEQPLIAGDLQPADVPGVWNETFTRDFGIAPPSDAVGCLQDIHWSAGLIGYFPTYALGNMYAAQFFDAAGRELGDLNEQFARGEFDPLRDWLRREIHTCGKLFPATELVQQVAGEELNSTALMSHLRGKFGALYGVV